MADPMEQLRLELKNKLSEEQFKLFQPQHLQGMVDEAYSAAVLPSASREGLSKAGLPAALVDVLLHAYNAPAAAAAAAAGAPAAAAAPGRALVSSATFRDGMKTLGDEHQAALAAQEKRLLQQQKTALDKALADQKREILESIGKGKHLKAH